MFYAFVLSLLIHGVLLLSIEPSKIEKKPVEKKVRVMLKQKKRKLRKLFSRKRGSIKKKKKRRITFGDLAISRTAGLDIAPVSRMETSTESIELFDLISGAVDYPQQFVDKGMYGNVIGDLYFDERGRFRERHSYINASNLFLKVYILRALRSVLYNRDFPIGKHYRLRLIVNYRLTINREVKDYSELHNDGAISLRRVAYGVTNGADAFMYGVEKSLVHIANILTLLEYLPDSDDKKRTDQAFWSSLKDDPAWR
jgi:hypothetical protein